MHRQIAGTLTGPLTKWIVLGLWIVVLFLAAPLAGKLTDVQDNQASSWLPASAESTKALDKLGAFQDENDIPTVVVYERSSGLGRRDLAQITSQVGQLQQLDGAIPARAPQGRPVPARALVQVSKDGQAAQAVVTFNFGKNGFNKLPDVAKQVRDIARIPGVTTHIAGPGGQAA